MRGLHVKSGHALLQVIGRICLELHQVAQTGVNRRIGQNNRKQLRIDCQCVDTDDLKQLVKGGDL